jgi:DNA-binding transcriptional MocR family regulator
VAQALSKVELASRLEELNCRYQEFCSKKLSLDITRGKPSADVLSLSNQILTCLSSEDFLAEDKTDCRNYGILDGIAEAKKLCGDILGVAPENTFVGGNSSLALMFDLVARAMSHGIDGAQAWSKLTEVKAICVVPGYDRHFSICEHFGIKMIPVELLKDGADVAQIKKLVENDDSYKLMWIVPRHSNPTGLTYSDQNLIELAKIKPKAKDFRIICDNAYAVHDWENVAAQTNFLKACQDAGNQDLTFLVGSTSKITFAGAGISFLAASANNLKWLKAHAFFQTIGYDKISMLRHVKFLKNLAGVKALMKKHAELIKPKFDATLDALEKNLATKAIASWTKPTGGYFVGLDVLPGTAKRVEKLAADAGLKLTKVGSTYPYNNDPKDSNIRIAPTFPKLDEVKQAMELLCVCVELAALEKLNT